MHSRSNRRTTLAIATLSTLALTGLANAAVSSDFNRSGSVGLDDLQAYLAAYYRGDKSADTNGDGQLSYSDIFAFSQQWTKAYISEPKKVTPIKTSPTSPAESTVIH